MHITLVTGTSRPGNRSQFVTKMVADLINQTYPDIEIEVVSPGDFNLVEGNNSEDEDKAWKELTAKTDGFIMVVPEYNHSAPGSLKMLIDQQYSNFRFKPVGLVGVSNGPWGGTRAIESLLSALKSVGLVMIQRDAHMIWVQDYIDEQGNIDVPEKARAKFNEEVLGMLEQFMWAVEKMKVARG